MILLEIDIRNDNVCLTLKEKATLTTPYYLFEVWCTQNIETKHYFTQTDTSDYPDSYNMFSIKAISSGVPNTSNGEFLCKQTDFWNYKVYETSTVTLDPDDAVSVVETGIMRVDIDRPDTIEIQHTNEVIILE